MRVNAYISKMSAPFSSAPKFWRWRNEFTHRYIGQPVLQSA
jgi:hypothetical protein